MSGARWQRPCPACGSVAAEALYDNRMAEIAGLDLSYRVARCAECGFAFADRLAAPETYAAYYRELSKYDVLESAAAVPAAHRDRARHARELCAPHVPRDAVVMDLGCGPGILLDEFRAAGWRRVHGVDPAPRAAEQAQRLFGLDGVRSGTLAQAHERLPLGEAGLVCLTGVLEHLPRLREDLAALAARLPAAAKLLIEVPALEGFLAPSFEPYGEFSLEHLQYFSAASLTTFLAQFGYRPLELRQVALSAGITDSLFGLFAKNGRTAAAPSRAGRDIAEYVRCSAPVFERALERVAACSAERFVLYGAGSHTARLLPALLARGAGPKLARLLDANPNLAGKTLGRLPIEPPQALAEEPGATVLISSFRAQEPIAQALARYPNPLLRLY